MHPFPSQRLAPGRSFAPGCAIAAGLLAVASPLLAAPAARPLAPNAAASPTTLRLDTSASFPLPPGTLVTVEEGGQRIFWEAKSGNLSIKAMEVGSARLRLETPGRKAQTLRLNLVERVAGVRTQGASQLVERAPLAGTLGTGTTSITTLGTPASPTSEQAPDQILGAPGAATTVPNTVPNTLAGGGIVTGANVAAGTALTPSPLSGGFGGNVAIPAPSAPAFSAPPLPTLATGGAATGARISPILPAPARSARANVNYRTTNRLPQGVGSARGREGIQVTQGLARLISFPSNILAVFFSDPNVMDARAINARTIAVTGVGAGDSTLAVFTAAYPGDVVGRANIYRVQTGARSGSPAAIEVRDPRVVARAITAALGDPRVRASIITLPDKSLAARLSGTVRNQIEVDAAVTTASFFVPRVIPALYADINAPTIDAVLAGATSATPDSALQTNLRRVTGNSSIELVPLPTGLAFKAEVNSSEEAESLLRVLPTLNQQVIPFIVIRGQQSASSPYYNATVPLLQGEDRQLTQKLQDVTGLRTVYSVRTASNGLACYGTVRTRSEYDRVRRYMHAMAQASTPPALQGTSQGGSTLRPQGGEGPSLPAYDPQGGYSRDLGLQMFVRITDPAQSVIRKVTVETNVVEISRTSLRNLGVEYGTATLLSESVTGGTTTTTNNGTTTTSASPIITTRTIDPSFNAGTLLAGNGFAGSGGFSNINPFRARLNALVSNGDARILSRPNITAVEGASAQITIGGERPVPSVVATQGAVGTQVEFRRYGVIISMRPTVTGTDTILLQIRADITQPDATFGINLNGAIIPGETVRSVDTTLNVKPGDIVVMGGLITNEKRQTLSKVPVLGDLPIIGPLFRSKRFDNNETELAIFMSPRIETMPASDEDIETLGVTPRFPSLPGRQESNGIAFQTTR